MTRDAEIASNPEEAAAPAQNSKTTSNSPPKEDWAESDWFSTWLTLAEER